MVHRQVILLDTGENHNMLQSKNSRAVFKNSTYAVCYNDKTILFDPECERNCTKSKMCYSKLTVIVKINFQS